LQQRPVAEPLAGPVAQVHHRLLGGVVVEASELVVGRAARRVTCRRNSSGTVIRDRSAAERGRARTAPSSDQIAVRVPTSLLARFDRR
jgi:hypothetical protein